APVVAPQSAPSHQPDFAFAPTAASPAPAASHNPANPFDNWDAMLDQPSAEPLVKPGKEGRRGRQHGVGSQLIAAAVVFAVFGTVIGGAILMYPKIKEQIQEARNRAGNSGTQPISTDPDGPKVAANQPQFPRRILGVCVNNYLFANPISYGYDPRG